MLPSEGDKQHETRETSQKKLFKNRSECVAANRSTFHTPQRYEWNSSCNHTDLDFTRAYFDISDCNVGNSLWPLDSCVIIYFKFLYDMWCGLFSVFWWGVGFLALIMTGQFESRQERWERAEGRHTAKGPGWSRTAAHGSPQSPESGCSIKKQACSD